MDNDPYIYSMKVWLLTSFISPVIGLLVIGDGLVTLEWFGVVLALGLTFSLPSFLLFMFITYWLYRLLGQAWKRKIILAFIGIGFVYLSFRFLDNNFIESKFLQFFFICYAAIVLASVIIVGQQEGMQEKKNNSVQNI